MQTPSRASISARSRAIVQFGRSATGSSSKGMTTRRAVSLFTGGGPGRDARSQRLDTAPGKIAAPQANRIFPHAEGLGNPRTDPAGKRQQQAVSRPAVQAWAAICTGSQGLLSGGV